MSQQEWVAARWRAEELTEPPFSCNIEVFGVRYGWSSYDLARDLIALVVYLRSHRRSQPVDTITAKDVLADVGDAARPVTAWNRDWDARDAALDELKQQLTDEIAAAGIDLHAPTDGIAADIAAVWWRLDVPPAPEARDRSDRIDLTPVIRQHFLLEAAQYAHKLLAEPAIATL